MRLVVESQLERYTCAQQYFNSTDPNNPGRVQRAYNELATLMEVPGVFACHVQMKGMCFCRQPSPLLGREMPVASSSSVHYWADWKLTCCIGDAVIRHLLTRGTHREFGYAALLVMLVHYFAVAAWVAGSAISSGLFVPMLVIGCLVGRLLGLVAVDLAATWGHGSPGCVPLTDALAPPPPSYLLGATVLAFVVALTLFLAQRAARCVSAAERLGLGRPRGVCADWRRRIHGGRDAAHGRSSSHHDGGELTISCCTEGWLCCATTL